MLARSALLAVLLTAAAPAAAVAAPPPVPIGPVAALAGDRVVTVLGEPPRPARVVLRGFDGTSTVLATLTPPGVGHGNDYVETVAASATTWAVALKRYFLGGEESPDFERGELIASGSTAGGPPRTLAACAFREEDPYIRPIDLTVSGDDVAWSSASCRGAGGVRLAPAGGGQVRFVGRGIGAALSPAWLAYFGFAGDQPRIELLDRASGTTRVVSTDPEIAAFGLDDAGIGAVIAPRSASCHGDCARTVNRLTADGAVARPGLVETLADGVGGPLTSTLVAGGGRVLASRPHGNGLVAVDLATGAVSYAGALGLDFDGTTPVSVDAANAVYMAPACDGTNELHVEPTRASAPARLSSVPCPVRLLRHNLTLRPHRRTARLPIRCPRGCHQDFSVVYRGQFIGSFAAHAPAGATRRPEVFFDPLRLLRRGDRIHTVTVVEDPESHPLARRQAPVRVVVRLLR